MPFEIHHDGQALLLELSGAVTVRDAAELSKSLAAQLTAGASVVVRSAALEDIDSCILQILISARKTVGALTLENPSVLLVNALDRCGLRREFASGAKEPA